MLFRNIEKLPSSKKENKVTVSKIDDWPPPVPSPDGRRRNKSRNQEIDEK